MADQQHAFRYHSKPLRISLEHITPVIAGKYLAKNRHNRRLRTGRIRELADQMKREKWHLNGETIKFSNQDELLDGQHRLHAIIAADVAITTLVVRDLSPEAFVTIDQGAKRSGGDIFHVCGVQYPSTVSSALTLIWQHKKGIILGSKNGEDIPSMDERVALFDEMPQVENYVVECATKGIQSIINGSTFAGLYALFAEINHDLAASFLNAVAGGAVRYAANPATQLRVALLKIKGSEYKPHRMALCSLIVDAWNRYIGGKHGEIQMANDLAAATIAKTVSPKNWQAIEAGTVSP
jgi:hypothetical protein